MKLFDVYCGFALYKTDNNTYVAKNSVTTLTASSYHDIYAVVKLHTV